MASPGTRWSSVMARAAACKEIYGCNVKCAMCTAPYICLFGPFLSGGVDHVLALFASFLQ